LAYEIPPAILIARAQLLRFAEHPNIIGVKDSATGHNWRKPAAATAVSGNAKPASFAGYLLPALVVGAGCCGCTS